MKKRIIRNPELHKKQLIDAMKKFHGIVTKACEAVGISRNQFYLYYNNDDNFRSEIDLMDDINLDTVEDKLFQNIVDRDRASIFFYLKYKGRKRGYVDSSDINISGGLDINLKNMFGFEEDEDNIKE
jgi:hypothetical protein